MSIRIVRFAVAFAVLTTLSGQIWADPLPGEILKFQQLPLDGGVPVVSPYLGPFTPPVNPFPVPPTPLSPVPSPSAPFPGHDEVSTAFATAFDANNTPIAWQGQFMADDFADRFISPVVHVRWWGSYREGQVFSGVKQFLISFESDVPSGAAGGPSRPGTPLLNQIVKLGPLAPGSGTFTEAIVPGATPNPIDGPLFQYNAELNLGKAFFENVPPNVSGTAPKPDNVYWLKIVALVDPNRDGQISWGWHDRDWSVPDLLASVAPAVSPGESIVGAVAGSPVWHFQDDAVSGTVIVTPGSSPIMPEIQQTGFVPQHYIDGVDGPTGIGQFSKDLAFELYTVPEPGSAVLLSLGCVALAVKRWRRNAR